MSPLVLAALLLAAAPPVSKAEALAAQKDAEGLFLEFGAVQASDYPGPERKRLAQALLAGAEAARNDPMIALGLAEKVSALDPSAPALALLAEMEVALGQRAAAAGHLDEALKLDPRYLPALLARAELAMKEEDFALAAGMYERAEDAGAKTVAAAAQKARLAAAAKAQAVDDLKRTEADIKVRVADAAKSATRDWLKQILAEEEETTQKRRLAPEGVRKQEMANFVFTYSAGSKKVGEMFAFESKVEKLLEKTYDFVADRLGIKIPGRTPVVLMTREEFAATHAGTPQARAGGYWDGGKIVINGGSTIDERFAAVMVHEFTHAVVSHLAGHGTVPRWMNEGLAENMRLSASGQGGKLEAPLRGMLGELKKQGRLPKLAQLDGLFVSMAAGVEVAYAMSAVAAEVLVDKRGYTEYVDALREMKGHRPLQVLERRLMSLEDIERAIEDAI